MMDDVTIMIYTPPAREISPSTTGLAPGVPLLLSVPSNNEVTRQFEPTGHGTSKTNAHAHDVPLQLSFRLILAHPLRLLFVDMRPSPGFLPIDQSVCGESIGK